MQLFRQNFRKGFDTVAKNGKRKPFMMQLEMLNAMINPPQAKPTTKYDNTLV